MPVNSVAPGELSPEEVARHHANGFTIVRGLFNPEEVAEIRAEFDRLWARTELIDRKNLRCRFLPHVETGEYVFECFDPYFDLSPLLAEKSRDPRLQGLMRSIYGEPGYVCHNQMIFKSPGTGGYPLHQDYVAWPIFPKKFHTVAIAIDPHDDEVGCLEMFEGVHQRGYLSRANGDSYVLPEKEVEGIAPTPLHLAAGDAAVFNCYIPHRSAANLTKDRWRRTLFYCFNPESEGGDFREEYYAYYREWSTEKRKQYGQTEVFFK